jgi:hypothetical protein
MPCGRSSYLTDPVIPDCEKDVENLCNSSAASLEISVAFYVIESGNDSYSGHKMMSECQNVRSSSQMLQLYDKCKLSAANMDYCLLLITF